MAARRAMTTDAAGFPGLRVTWASGPDITLARPVLGWEPEVDLRQGLALTAEWFRSGRS